MALVTILIMGYGEIENYGSAYQPIEGGYQPRHGIINRPLINSKRPYLGDLDAFGQHGLGRYGTMYPETFNPMLQPGLGGPKVRVIFIPNNALYEFQNLLQGGMGNANPLIGGLGGANPFIGGTGLRKSVSRWSRWWQSFYRWHRWCESFNRLVSAVAVLLSVEQAA